MASSDTQQIPRWLWGVVVTVMATMGTGAGSTVGMVCYAVWDHERRITVLERDYAASVRIADKLEGKLDSIDTTLREMRRDVDRALNAARAME